MRSATHLALILGSLTLLACSEPPDLSVEIQTFAGHVNEIRSGMCMCPADVGFDTPLECGDALGFAGEGESQCMAAVLEDYGDDGASYLACMSSAYGEGGQCLTANVNCAEGQLDACEQTRAASSSSCTQIPEGGQGAFLACVAGT